jgi:hypothetical protein
MAHFAPPLDPPLHGMGLNRRERSRRRPCMQRGGLGELCRRARVRAAVIGAARHTGVERDSSDGEQVNRCGGC